VSVPLLPRGASAFPGIVVARDAARRVVTTTHVVVMLGPGVSVVTVVADVRGPLGPFAVVLPVPSDVSIPRLRTVKREFVARVEQVSAPRFHSFYEKDPCRSGPAVQAWEERIKARGRGFLAPSFLPPLDKHWKVPNDMAIATEPVFKGKESEFVYHVLAPRRTAELGRWLRRRGYRVSEALLEPVGPYLSEGRRVLVAEVELAHVELLGSDRVQLGGISYWSRQALAPIPSTLGLAHLDGHQDLFVYVMDRSRRYEAANYPSFFPPTNLDMDVAAEEHMASLYNALYDHAVATDPGAFANEFVWPTDGCGEPCANAPLQLRELLSLGGDVLEAETVSASDRWPAPGAEAEQERKEFDDSLAGLSVAERSAEQCEHEQLRRELARRRALLKRQRYVLSRLHYRYDTSSLPRDVSLGPAAGHVRGGVGVPQGPSAELALGTEPAPDSRYQVRFVHSFPWTGSLWCPRATERWRWGKRWKSLAHVWRGVWLAEDLPGARRDPVLLRQVLRTPLPGLGGAPPTRPPARPATRTANPSRPNTTCSLPPCPATVRLGGWGLLALLELLVSRRRTESFRLKRRPDDEEYRFRWRRNRGSFAALTRVGAAKDPAFQRKRSTSPSQRQRTCPWR
jgi:hypothetical protein